MPNVSFNEKQLHKKYYNIFRNIYSESIWDELIETKYPANSVSNTDIITRMQIYLADI
jgi:hypothetical protein